MSYHNTDTFKNYSGDIIELEVLFQYPTYITVLTGYPTRSRNTRLINSALETAREKLWNCNSPFLITPVERSLNIPIERWSQPGEEFEPITLPAFTCLATFNSTNRLLDSDYSVLHVVWFQSHFAMPIEPEIVTAISAIDWSIYGTACYF